MSELPDEPEWKAALSYLDGVMRGYNDLSPKAKGHVYVLIMMWNVAQNVEYLARTRKARSDKRESKSSDAPNRRGRGRPPKNQAPKA